jgi:cytolysin-activating lysine-acyltransferase
LHDIGAFALGSTPNDQEARTMTDESGAKKPKPGERGATRQGGRPGTVQATIETKATSSGAAANGGPAAAGTAPADPAAGKTVAQIMGEIVWLMSQSARHKAMPIGDLEWLAMPPILLQQFRLFYQGERPVGVVLWALVDDAVARRIDAGERRLSPAEWKCGTEKRIVEVVAPFGGEGEMRASVMADVVAGTAGAPT